MHILASTIMVLKEIMQASGHETELALIQKLAPETRLLYDNLSKSTWISMEADNEIKRTAGPLLFPGQPDSAKKLQRLIAKKTYYEQFNVLRHHPTLKDVQAAGTQLWNQLWDQGRIRIDKVTDTSLNMTLLQCPELIKPQLELISGYVCGILELTGARSIRDVINDTDPAAWQWTFTWR